MKSLFKQDGVWVYSHNKIEKSMIPILFKSRDIGIFDLDDCDAKRPGKWIVYHHLIDILSIKKCPDSRFFYWAVTKGLKARLNKSAEGPAFKEYFNYFLRDTQSRKKAGQTFSRDIVKEMIFPGIIKFYNALPKDIFNVRFTRNIYPIAAVFSNAFPGHWKILSEISDKPKTFENLIKTYKFSHYLIKEDFEDDALSMINILKFYENKKIGPESHISVFVSNNTNYQNNEFDFVIGRDHTGLVKLMNS